MKPPSLLLIPLAASLVLAGGSSVQAAGTLVAMSTFGGGDGTLLPADYGGSTAGNSERQIAYNPVTGNVGLVSRQTTNRVDILNGTTGATVKTMTAPGAGYASAVLNITAIGISTDGQIFVTNLADGNNVSVPAQTLSVYSWGSESSIAAPSVSTILLPAGLRLGDSMDAYGSGSAARAIMGFNDTNAAAAAGDDGWGVIDPATGTLTIMDPLAGSAASALRLSIAVVDGDTVIGNQNGITRLMDYSSGTVTAVNSVTGMPTTDRAVDVVTIGGKQYLAALASLDAVLRNTVNIYELNGTTATFMTSANLLGLGNANANGTGDVDWGAVTGDSATLYTVTTNSGIQAFVFTVPEPSLMSLGLLGSLLCFRRKRS